MPLNEAELPSSRVVGAYHFKMTLLTGVGVTIGVPPELPESSEVSAVVLVAVIAVLPPPQAAITNMNDEKI